MSFPFLPTSDALSDFDAARAFAGVDRSALDRPRNDNLRVDGARVDGARNWHGRRLGRWKLESLAGEGAMARVFRAQREDAEGVDPDRDRAVKVLRPAWSERPEAQRLLAREWEVSREVRHPHLIALDEAQLDHAPHFLVMQWLHGQTLRQRLHGGCRLSVPMALSVTRQTAEALGALHDKGWVHGDVKPSNVFLAPNGRATLIDLGFARRIGPAPRERELLGTVDYMAPERMATDQPLHVSGDLYSLGVLLFESLTGRLPFVGRDLADLARHHRLSPPPDVQEFNPEVPPSAAGLVRELLSKNPQQRPMTPDDLIRRLVLLEIELFHQR